MNNQLEQLLKEKQVPYVQVDGELIKFICDGIGYCYYPANVTTQLIDRAYNNFNSYQITALIVYVESLPGAIVIDYAARRNIKISSKERLEQFRNDCQDLGAEATNDCKQENNNIDQVDFEEVEIVEKKVSEEQAADTLNMRSTQSAEPIEEHESKPSSSTAQKELTDEEIKQELAKILRKRIRKAQARRRIIIMITSICVIIFINLLESLEVHTENVNRDTSFIDMPVVADYSFDPRDILPLSTEYNIEQMDALYNLQIGTGKDYLFNQQTNPFPTYATADDEYELIVGSDIEPGIYTISVSGDARISDDSELYTTIDSNGINNYNIPLATGTTITITPDNEVVDYQLQLTPQTQFTKYEEGLSGLFIYGLTYFDTNLNIDLENNYVYYLYPYDDQNSERVQIEDYGKDTYPIAGIPGSYVYVETK